MADIPVFCLSGLKAEPNTRMEDNYLGGQLFTSPYTRRDVLYPNNLPTIPAATEGAEKAYDGARKAKGPCILAGHSEGAEALQILLRSAPDLDPEKVVLVLGGNPERFYGGITTIAGSGFHATYGGVGFPADTPFRVFDISRQYEFWCDYPDILPNPAAVRNAYAGFGLHLDYSGVRVGDPNNVKHVEGNITWEMQPTFPMPSCRKLWWRADREALEDRKIRASIETGYTRPPSLVPPPQTVKRYSADTGYDTVNRRAVRISATTIWNPFARSA